MIYIENERNKSTVLAFNRKYLNVYRAINKLYLHTKTYLNDTL